MKLLSVPDPFRLVPGFGNQLRLCRRLPLRTPSMHVRRKLFTQVCRYMYCCTIVLLYRLETVTYRVPLQHQPRLSVMRTAHPSPLIARSVVACSPSANHSLSPACSNQVGPRSSGSSWPTSRFHPASVSRPPYGQPLSISRQTKLTPFRHLPQDRLDHAPKAPFSPSLCILLCPSSSSSLYSVLSHVEDGLPRVSPGTPYSAEHGGADALRREKCQGRKLN